MIERRFIDLMHAEIDGTNSEEESRALREHLERSGEAREYYEELVEVGRRLASAAPVSPPPWLRASIMRAVAARDHSPGRASLAERLRARLAPAPRVRLAYAFAGGVVVGLCLFAALSVTVPMVASLEGGALVGTMGGRCTISGGAVTFDQEGAAGSASLRYCAENVTLDLRLSSDEPIRVFLDFDDEVDFEGVRALQPGDHAVSVTGHSAEITHSGTRDYTVTFTDYTESRLPIRMRVQGQGGLLFEGTVPPGRE